MPIEGLHKTTLLYKEVKNMNELFFPDAFLRGFIGADRLTSLNDRISNMASTNFPPHNLEKVGDDTYVLTFALAGFSPEDIQLSVHGDVLSIETVSGINKEPAEVNPKGNFIHRGISFRHFTRKFVLGEYIHVGSADMENGLLKITLERVVPEAAKPKVIPIGYNNKVEAINFTENRKAVA
jgi:molecular chaperone IbpA